MFVPVVLAVWLAVASHGVRGHQGRPRPVPFYSDLQEGRDAAPVSRLKNRHKDGVPFYSDLERGGLQARKHRAHRISKQARRKAGSEIQESKAQCVDTTFSRDGDCSKHGGVFWRIRE